ncbi:tetratricopeptide repeat-containing glycosyltransferase family protein [Propionivibrio soli]|uniref:tetratricopeptide repeat-containing glycosyltransferase family protein n=1 Tax=Propionivibrio soli TaxID=2976531 RepID=UPI0021E9779A
MTDFNPEQRVTLKAIKVFAVKEDGLSPDVQAYLPEILASMLRATEFRLAERWEDALECLDAALSIDPLFVPCYVDRAMVLGKLGRYEEALEFYDKFLRLASPAPEIALMRHQLLDEAFADFDRRIDAEPSVSDARLRRAELFRLADRPAEAIADYEAVLRNEPRRADVLNNLGTALLALGRHGEALSAYENAITGDPKCAEAWHNLGNVLQKRGQVERARAAYREALALVPDLAEAHMEIGHSLLLEGNSDGWPYLEWRWQTRYLKDAPRPSECPVWLGETNQSGAPRPWSLAEPSLSGKTILLWAEQGLGDTLQFVRFASAVAALAAHVILRVQAPLRELMQSRGLPWAVIGDDEPIPSHDVHCPLLSLPLALGLKALPAAQPYLRADAEKAARWAALLGPKSRPRVGLAWAGRQHGAINPTRDMPLAVLLPLAGANVEWVSLQKDIPTKDEVALEAFPELRRFEGGLSDYSETAALIDNLDLVISVDTSVAHLAGALGKPCRLMLRADSEWRWQRDRADSPWYATLEIFRQPSPGDWDSVVAQIARRLVVAPENP